MEMVAFVYMPEHVHLLVCPLSPSGDISLFLAKLKNTFSKVLKQQLLQADCQLLQQLMVRERPDKMVFRFWQEGPGFDRNIFNPAAISASIDYIHNNPVRRGLCLKAVDWKWSSRRYYLEEPPRQQFADLPHVQGVPIGAFDHGQPG